MSTQPNLEAPILTVKDLRKTYEIKNLFSPLVKVRALDGISFTLGKKETLAVVGESGCGKSTLAKVLMQIEPATEGKIEIEGRSLQSLGKVEVRRAIQMIFQDPYGSLNPRKKVWKIVAEPLMINAKLSKAEYQKRAVESMLMVGLRPETQNRYPHMFSGGQRQRIGIARALILHPKIVICDEPVSALDVSIQAQVINQLVELQDQLGLSYIFISHDLSVVRHLADQVMVIYLGRVAEYGTRNQVFKDPKHPYTKALLASTPSMRHQQKGGQANEHLSIKGELPSVLNPPAGCAFHKRCPVAIARCAQELPPLREVAGRKVACHLAE